MAKRKGRSMKNVGTVRSNLAALVELKAKQLGVERIPNSEIAAETRLALNTVKLYLHGNQDRFEAHAIAALCKYLNCGIEDLLKLVDTTDAGQASDTDD